MARKIMLEVTQPVVDGNELVVAAGTLFEEGATLPEGVTVREVVVDADDQPAAEAKAAPEKPAAKAPAK